MCEAFNGIPPRNQLGLSPLPNEREYLMPHTITIAGKPFSVEPRYSEGHTLNANEASALNQTFFENLRNNFAGKAKDNGTQEDFDAYVASYQFGVRVGGGGSRDPIESEAMNMARDQIKAAIRAKGGKIADYSAESITAAAGKLLDKDPTIRELARKRVEEMQSTARAAVDDDLLSGLEAAKPAEQETETDTSGATEEAPTASSSRKPKAGSAETAA